MYSGRSGRRVAQRKRKMNLLGGFGNLPSFFASSCMCFSRKAPQACQGHDTSKLVTRNPRYSVVEQRIRDSFRDHLCDPWLFHLAPRCLERSNRLHDLLRANFKMILLSLFQLLFFFKVLIVQIITATFPSSSPRRRLVQLSVIFCVYIRKRRCSNASATTKGR